jgi:outer membrane receptor for ferrienterochelin and colicins
MSRNSSTARPRCWALLLALALALLPAAAHAQAAGRITGTVVDTQGAPVSGAQVSISGTRLGTLTNASGQFVITGVPAGAHQLRVQFTGYGTALQPVTVQAGEAASVRVTLEGEAIQLGGVVVSASRRAERITDAPATITQISAEVIDNSVGNSWATLLKEVKGLDFVQTGMTTVAINARGFNSSFNNRMLMMEDGRVAVLPENGLPVGQFTAIPKVDLAGVEVLVGPGAALYGADASSGVVTLMSRDPRRFPGTTVEVTGGNRNYKDVQARHAGVIGDWGYKVSGEWQDADDWSNTQSYAIAGVPGRGTVMVADTALGANSINWNTRAVRGSGALVRYFNDGRLELSAGASQSDGVGQTNVGRNQLRDWGYNFAQAKYSNSNWYLNAYRTQSTSGESYAINRYADAFARNPSLSSDSLRLLSDWPSDGRMYSAELQNNFRLPALLNTELIWGAQYRRDMVSSDRQWLTDRLTGEDISISQYGVYAQVETPLLPSLDLVLAGRYDRHENYDPQFSPKAGLVFKPVPDQAIRVTYNRAFKSPSTLQTNFYIPDWTPVVTIFGNTEGFSVRNADGSEFLAYQPLRPEENRTWEVGYKGILGERLFVDVAGYYSNYEDFLSPLAIISDPFGIGLAGAPKGTKTFAYDAQGNLIKSAAGLTPLVLTYYNLGRATIYGTDAGFNYYATPRINLRGTLSLLKVDNVEVPANRAEATAINSPGTKWTLGADFTDVGSFLDGRGNFLGGFTMRHVNSYYFRSGINRGVIPTFTTLDLNVGYKIARINSTVNLGLSNLFACSQNDDQPFTYDAKADPFLTRPLNKERQCGFGVKHQEMINMPEIGTMLFLGMRYHVQ